MKKILLSAIFAASAQLGFSQLEQGTILLGGDVRFNNRTTEDFDNAGDLDDKTSVNELSLNIRGGYFIIDNLAAGLRVGFGNSRTTIENPGTPPALSRSVSRSSTMSFGAFARIYQMLGESRFALFGQLDLSYGLGKSSNENTSIGSTGTSVSSTTRSEYSVIDVGIAPGITFFVTDRMALEATIGRIGYSMNNRTDFNAAGDRSGETATSVLNVSLNPSNVAFGITFFLGGSGTATTTK